MKIDTIFSLLCFLLWGLADLFYKKSNNEKDKYSDLKTAIVVGIVMGLYATGFIIYKGINFNNIGTYLIGVLKYLPVSFSYIISMYIGYKGLKYIELSISSPVQNTSWVITSLLLLLFFKEVLPGKAYIAFILIFIGIFGVSLLEKKDNKVVVTKKNKILAIVFPLIYCLIDGLGTFLDAIYLDKFELVSENVALVAYEYTFLFVAIIGILYLRKHNEKLTIKKDKTMWIAAVFETLGQFFYVFAMGSNSTINASIVGSYCILSLLLSSIFLKEKLSIPKYIFLLIAIIGIVILAILDI